MKILEKLEIVQGKTLGEKMQNLTSNLNITASRIRALWSELGYSWIPLDGNEHKERRAQIDEHYERWMTCFVAMLETGIGDWIHGTNLWNDFWNAGSDLHEDMMGLIKAEHSSRVDEK